MSATPVAVADGVRLHRYLCDDGSSLARDVRRGLTAPFKQLSPKYFYDAVGSRLFEQITELPEYYQTRTELQILQSAAPELVARHRPSELVELGAGYSRKTIALLDAMSDAGTLRRFIPFDVSPTALLDAADHLTRRYDGLRIDAVAGDFDHHLGHIPEREVGGRRLVIFLGGTIGNLYPAERRVFLRTLRSLLQSDDRLLVGVDLVKDHAVLHAAYNDAAGVTAAFNRNVLHVLNRELDADFVPERFEHVAFYDPDAAWIEMRLRSTVRQQVQIGGLGLSVTFEAGEEMRTEVSCKFTQARLTEEVAAVGLHLEAFHTDPARMFGVLVATRSGDQSDDVSSSVG